METKKCKSCQMDIPKKAKKCPHCQSDQRNWVNRHPFLVVGLGLFLLIVISIVKASNKEEVIQQVADNQAVKINLGCNVSNAPISYSVLEERTRKSDVEGINIKECYILLNQKAPTLDNLKGLATSLGVSNENIEFFIFDDKRAYEIDKRYDEVLASGGKDSDIPDSDWKIWDEHFLATYLKAHTRLRNNRLQPVSDIYQSKEAIQISN